MTKEPVRMTAAEFEQARFDLPEAGRFHELHEGCLTLLSTPEEIHGTIVFNISRILAGWLPAVKGSAAYGIGLHVAREPDTVYAPAISVFLGGRPFSQADLVVATEVPALVVDIASTNDRRSDMRRRTTSLLQLGVETVWVPDPFKKEIQVISRGQHTLALGAWQKLTGIGRLQGLEFSVADSFAQPKWWDGKLPEVS
ncbi:MAG: Uma2 family endonuclease [Planctomyces sp.]|jgi:Uma2 family endonuclease